MKYNHILVITGAGISAESGVPTFTGPGGMDSAALAAYHVGVASAEAIKSNPAHVHAHMNPAQATMRTAQPNAAHYDLARLAGKTKVTILTTNVDDLHQRAGQSYPAYPGSKIIPFHGELNKARWRTWNEAEHAWEDTDRVVEWPHDITPETILASNDGLDEASRKHYEEGGPLKDNLLWHALRRDVVVDNQFNYHLDEVQKAIEECDLCLVIGVSGRGQDIGAMIDMVNRRGNVPVIDINIDPKYWADFKKVHEGKAGDIVPGIVNRIIHGGDALSWQQRVEGPRDGWGRNKG